jgi:hypothetical protein
MMKQYLKIQLTVLATMLMLFNPVANAQTQLRQGVLQFNQLVDLSRNNSTTLSYGTLAQLRADPNFIGNLQTIVDAATTILDGYRVVNRGGGFPENAGIPLNQQLTRAEAPYRIFKLDNGYELVLFRSPLENTAQYFIRTPNNSF